MAFLGAKWIKNSIAQTKQTCCAKTRQLRPAPSRPKRAKDLPLSRMRSRNWQSRPPRQPRYQPEDRGDSNGYQGAVEPIATISAVINQLNDISTTNRDTRRGAECNTNEMFPERYRGRRGSNEISQNITAWRRRLKAPPQRARSMKAAQALAQMSTATAGLVSNSSDP